MGDRLGSSSQVRTSEDKVCRKNLCWSVRIVYVLDKLPDVIGPDLGEAGRYRMVSEPTLAVSRACTSVNARACGRARGGSVRVHLGCTVGTGRTDVAQGSLALDVWDMAKRGCSWLGIDRRGRRSLKGMSM
jgi:hypothetical protein